MAAIVSFTSPTNTNYVHFYPISPVVCFVRFHNRSSSFLVFFFLHLSACATLFLKRGLLSLFFFSLIIFTLANLQQEAV